MKMIGGVALVIAALLFYFSLKFGFDLKTAFYTFVSLAIFAGVAFVAYRLYDDTPLPKVWFYVAAGALLTLCFHPLLDFYSIKSASYGLLDWAGMKEQDNDVAVAWFGTGFAKIALALVTAFIAVCYQQVFDNDD